MQRRPLQVNTGGGSHGAHRGQKRPLIEEDVLPSQDSARVNKRSRLVNAEVVEGGEIIDADVVDSSREETIRQLLTDESYAEFEQLVMNDNDNRIAISVLIDLSGNDCFSDQARRMMLVKLLCMLHATKDNAEFLASMLPKVYRGHYMVSTYGRLDRPSRKDLRDEIISILNKIIFHINNVDDKLCYDVILQQYRDIHQYGPYRDPEKRVLDTYCNYLRDSKYFDRKSILRSVFSDIHDHNETKLFSLLRSFDCQKEIDVIHQLLLDKLQQANYIENSNFMLWLIRNLGLDLWQPSAQGKNFLEFLLCSYIELDLRGAGYPEPVAILWDLFSQMRELSHRFSHNGAYYTVRQFIDKYQDHFKGLRGKILDDEIRKQPLPPYNHPAPQERRVVQPAYAPAMPDFVAHPQVFMRELTIHDAPQGNLFFQPAPRRIPPRPLTQLAHLVQPPAPFVQREVIRPMHQDKQSTHGEGIHNSVSIAARKLFDKYFSGNTYNQATKKQKTAEILDFLKVTMIENLRDRLTKKFLSLGLDQKVISILVESGVKDFVAAFDCSNHIVGIKDVFGGIAEDRAAKACYVLVTALSNFVDFRDASSGISLGGALVTVWAAIHDADIFKTEEDRKTEKRLFMARLEELGGEYGEGVSSCASGIFNGLIEFLDQKHPLVKISRISSSNLYHYIKDHIDDVFMKLDGAKRREMIGMLGHFNIIPSMFLEDCKKSFLQQHHDEVAAGVIRQESIHEWFSQFGEEDAYQQCSEIKRHVAAWASEQEDKNALPTPKR